MVDTQHVDRCNTDCGASDERGAAPREVIGPRVFTRMIQPHDLIRFSDPARDVRAFVSVAVEAAPSQIGFNRRTTVFFGDDVINLERIERAFFRELAVFADATGAVANELPKRVIHACLRRSQHLVRFEFEHLHQAATTAELF
jgi:hypothetical protein